MATVETVADALYERIVEAGGPERVLTPELRATHDRFIGVERTEAIWSEALNRWDEGQDHG